MKMSSMNERERANALAGFKKFVNDGNDARIFI